MPSPSINTELLLHLLERQQAMEKALGIGVEKVKVEKAPKIGSRKWVQKWSRDKDALRAKKNLTNKKLNQK